MNEIASPSPFMIRVLSGSLGIEPGRARSIQSGAFLRAKIGRIDYTKGSGVQQGRAPLSAIFHYQIKRKWRKEIVHLMPLTGRYALKAALDITLFLACFLAFSFCIADEFFIYIQQFCYRP